MVDAITSPTVTIPAATPSAAGAGGFAGAGAGGDFQTFLTMLTAQLQNQDPLNPMESTDFAIQLATFAGVEQAALSNKFLEQMAGQAGGAGIAGWIGKEARTTAPVWFDDEAITLDVVHTHWRTACSWSRATRRAARSRARRSAPERARSTGWAAAPTTPSCLTGCTALRWRAGAAAR